MMVHGRQYLLLRQVCVWGTLISLSLLFEPCRTSAQETVSLRSGRLLLRQTDHVLRAGPAAMTIQRSLLTVPGQPGLLGGRWRFDWEVAVSRTGTAILIQEGDISTLFKPTENARVFRSDIGERLVPAEDGAMTRRSDDGSETLYDSQGRLSARQDRNGGRILFRYDSHDRLAKIEGPRGRSYSLTCDDAGRVIRIDASSGEAAEYVYRDGELAEVRLNSGPATRYHYNEQGWLSRIDWPLEGTVTLTYDPQGRVTGRRWADGADEFYEYQDDPVRTIRHINTAGGITIFRYDVERRRTETTDPDGTTTVMDTDDQERPVQILHPDGTVAKMSYDSLGRLEEVQGRDGRTLHYAYDGDTRRIRSIAQGNDVRLDYEYDARGNLLALRKGEQQVLSLTYYPDGQIKSKEGIGNPRRSLAYYPNGLLKSESDALGQTTTYVYDERGNLTRLTDAAGEVTSWTYDARNRVLSETDPAGAVTQYAYDPNGRLTTETDPVGSVTHYAYDARGRLLSRTDPPDNVTRFSYNGAGLLTRVTDPVGNEIRYEYDQSGRLVRELNPVGGSTRYTYHPTGQLASVTDPSGRTWRYKSSADGLTMEITGPLNEHLTVQIDPVARTRQTKDQSGRVETLQVDAEGRPVKIASPGDRPLSYRYDEKGYLVQVSDDSGLQLDYTYDPLGRVTERSHASGLRRSYEYDAVGNLVRIQDNQGGHAQMRYDSRGLLTEWTDALGGTLRYAYDPSGRLLQETNPLGRTTTYAYSAAGDLSSITEPGGNTTQLRYNAAGFLTELQHGDGGATRVTRDALGNALEVTDPQDRTVRNTYDSAGRLIRRVNGRGQETSFNYDAAGRLDSERFADGTIVRYRYDAAGNLIDVNDGVFPVGLSYDESGRLTRREYPAIRRALTYAYNDKSQLERFEDSEGRAYTYSYDRLGRLSSITPAEDKPIKLTYDRLDRLTELTFSNGVTGAWQYDALGRPSRLTCKDPAGKTLLSRVLTYDADGNPVTVADESGDSSVYTYNAAGQLSREQGPSGDIQYGYTRGGSRAAVTTASETVSYRYDEADHLVQAGQERFVYDADGNIIERTGPGGTTRYRYDSENRLVAVTRPDDRTVSFGYAPTGERIWRQDGKNRTWFVTDGVNLFAELDEDLKPKTTYLHGPGIDRPLLMWWGDRTYCYHVDHLGSVVALTDERGKLVTTYRTDAFGNAKNRQDTTGNPLLYTARYYEKDLGLYYYRARFYDPVLGRFLSKDPYYASPESPANVHLYAYVHNVPTRYRDPLGLLEDPVLTEQLNRHGLTEQQFVDRLVNPEVKRLELLYRTQGITRPREETYQFAQNLMIKQLRSAAPEIGGQRTVDILRGGMAADIRTLRNAPPPPPQIQAYEPPFVPRSASPAPPAPQPNLSVTRPGTPPPGAQPAPAMADHSTVRVHGGADHAPLPGPHTVIAPQTQSPSSGGPTSGPRSPSLLSGGRASVQRPGFFEIDRPLTSGETVGMGALGVLSAVEIGNRLYHSDNPADEVKSVGLGLAVGTTVALGGAALVGSGPVLVGGLALSIASHVDDVRDFPGEAWQLHQARNNANAAEQNYQQFLDKLTEAIGALTAAQNNLRAELTPLQNKITQIHNEAQATADTTRTTGEEAGRSVGEIQLPPLVDFESALTRCQQAEGMAAELENLRKNRQTTEIGAKEAELTKVKTDATRLHRLLADALATKDRIFRLADQAARAKTTFATQATALAEAQARLTEAKAKWRQKIAALEARSSEAAAGPQKDAFTAKLRETQALIDSFKSDESIDASKEKLDAGVTEALNAKLTAENKVNIDFENCLQALAACSDTRIPQAQSDSSEGSRDESRTVSTADANDSRPTMETDGFSDESDTSTPAQTTPTTTPPPDDGFGDDTTEPAPSRPTRETVTYFDRPWMPQSWRTSGNSREVRVNIYCAGSRLGWAAALARHSTGQADQLIVEHLQAASMHVKATYDNSFMPRKAWPDWQQTQNKHDTWARLLLEKAPGPNGPNYRRSLNNTLKGQALSLADAIAYQGAGQLEHMENCDSYYMRIGYYLADAAQSLTYAAEGQANGMPNLQVRRIIGEAISMANMAAKYMRNLKTLKLASGYCIDLTEIAETMHRGISSGNPLPKRAAAVHQAWEAALNALGGGGQKVYDPDELAGEWAFSDLTWAKFDSPEWKTQYQPQLQKWDPAIVYTFSVQGGEYVGTLLKEPGAMPGWFSAWSNEPRIHGHLFKPGVVLFRLKKIGQNRYQGSRYKAGIPGSNSLSPEPFDVVVQGQVARYGAGGNASSQVSLNEAPLLVRYDPPPKGSVPDIEAIGRYVFAELPNDRPRGASIEKPSFSRAASGKQTYFFSFKRPFRFQYATDNNPGVSFTLTYNGKEEAFANHRRFSRSDNVTRLVREETVLRHGQEGHWALVSMSMNDPFLMSQLVWSYGDWTLVIHGSDYPRHPDTMFGGEQGMYQYTMAVFEKLATRIVNIPLANVAPASPTTTPPAEPRQQPSGGVDLLGQQVR